MSVIKSASPIGFNIKTKNRLIFAGEKLYPPFLKNVCYDMEKNPYRWNIEYEKAKQEKIEDEKIEDEKLLTNKTTQVKAKRKKITIK